MRQMRYAGDCGIVVGNFDRDSFSAGELDELGDIGKNLDPELARVFVFYGVVKSNSPRGLLKQSGVRVVPPGIRGTSHRVGTNIVSFQTAVFDQAEYFRFHGDDVGKATIGGMLFDGI